MSPSDSPSPAATQSIADREAALLGPWALHSAQSAGRKIPEAPHPYRGPFQRDRDRIVHSAAYRRLSAKTQVFTGELGDYHRTRLTHTLEVSSVARTLGRALRLNEDLVEALAVLHDLGHPPFGHAGEDVLDQCLAAAGGFSHNAQALRIVELLEVRYGDFAGLNLSLEVLEGQAARSDKQRPGPSPLLEVQVVDAADSITYDTHDADDALKLGLLSLDELLQTSLWAEAARRVRARYAALDERQRRRSILHELIDWQVGDLVQRVAARLQSGELASVEDVRRAAPLVLASPELAEQKRALESFLYERVYRHPQVIQHRLAAQDYLRRMFELLLARPELLPPRFRTLAAGGLPRAVGDYLSGMTDRYVIAEYRRLLSPG